MIDNKFERSGVVSIMRAKPFFVLALLSLAACNDRPSQPPPSTAVSTSTTVAHPARSASAGPVASSEALEVTEKDALTPAMSDVELGTLIASLSEPTGDFPSDNFVSNETSYLHVSESMLSDKLRGKVFLGVGPEQNLSYVTMMRPAVAYIVDIRRQNMLEHMVLRALAEDANNRATFLARLTGRDISGCSMAKPELATIDEIADALAELEASDERVDREVQRTLALMARLGMKRAKGDEPGIRNVLKAFADKGLDLAYSMKGSGRRYPGLRKLLATADPGGAQLSFVANESSFQYLQGMYRANRVVPVVGDFSGDGALRSIADDVRKRNLVLGVFYTSNVEQYLFEGGTYAKFISNIERFPIDDSSLFLRVWFDQGRAHPKQQKGHRTTSLTMPIRPFLERHKERPFPTYWHVMTWDGLSKGR